MTYASVPAAALKKFKEFDNHHDVVRFGDDESGLKGFIAIHRRRDGSAIGGTRLWSYANEDEALQDALRLSRAMTYKCAMADIAMGGGKGVIVLEAGRHYDRKALMEAYADVLNRLGNFYTGEDVGMTQDDVGILAGTCPFIVGRPGVGGDPGPWAALSVYHSILAALKEVFGSDTVGGRSFAIKGLGKVGGGVARFLAHEGGVVFAADIDAATLERAKTEVPGITIVSPDEIHAVEVDVYIPCALGGEIDEKKVNELKCRIVCGGANNQLASPDIDDLLSKLGIAYVPDYVANAGGLINVAAELNPEGYHEEYVDGKVRNVAETVRWILRSSREQGKTPERVANELAEAIFSG